MTSSEVLFQQLLKSLRPSLAPHGFRLKGQNFIIETSECWGILNFQKSRSNSSEETKFTINLAVAAKRIVAFEGGAIGTPPPYFACHWVCRIGELLPKREDKWWTLTQERTLVRVEGEIRNVLAELALPNDRKTLH